MTYYCNDCGEPFDPQQVSDSFPDGVGRCPSCIHESGDCPQHPEMNCGECRKNHELGHPLIGGGPYRYCQLCTNPLFQTA